MRENWSPTVRPPRLGGNKRMGVFATRSPFRPNPIGLSCVRLIGVEKTANSGLAIRVSGIDMMDGTPIYDIKPYLPAADCHPEASGGFAKEVPKDKQNALTALLAQDPRPSYQNDPDRIYGFCYAGLEVKFRVDGEKLYVTDIE